MKVVMQWEDAFEQKDCGLLVRTTTKAWRDHYGLTDCTKFLERANGRANVIRSTKLTPTGASSTGRGTMVARVHADLRSTLDANGQPVDSPVLLKYDYRYHLVRTGGGWKIDSVHDVTGGRTEGHVTDDEQRHVDEMMADWAKAYSSGDCNALHASTTAAFQRTMGWTDCAAFQKDINDQNAYCPMTVHQEDIRFHDLVDPHSGEIFVDVVEVCTLKVDESGNPIDPPFQRGAPYRFHLVHAGDGWKIAEGDDGAAAEDVPANTNERAAVDAMRTYNKAWTNPDCGAFMATTTEDFRASLELTTCETFTSTAKDYAQSVRNFALVSTDIERPSAKRMQIKSRETYESLTDENGTPVDPPIPVDEYWVYTVDLVNGVWVISSSDPLL